MIAVTVDYYLNTWGGVSFADLEGILARAGNVIEPLVTVPPGCEEQERCYKNAVCAQAEQIGLCGGIAAWLSQNSTGGSFTIGSFSMSGGSSGSGDSSAAFSGSVCTEAIVWLEKGCLTYRGRDAL